MVASRVAKGIVDLFEPIEVEREQRDRILIPFRFDRKYVVRGS